VAEYGKTSKLREILEEKLREETNEISPLQFVALELAPIAIGACLGSLGRHTGEHWIPAVPVAIDLMHNAEGINYSRGFRGYLEYGLGVALPYLDIVVPVANDLVYKFLGK